MCQEWHNWRVPFSESRLQQQSTIMATGAKLIISLLFVGALYTADGAITEWSEPTIASAASGSGSYTFAENIATGTATVATQFAATTDVAGGSATFSLLTSGTPFSVASDGTLSLDTALDFETKATYTLEVQADDAAPASGIATITVTVTDVNEAPAFGQTSYGVNIADGSTAGATLITALATDQDTGDVITHSLAAGNAAGHFTIDGATGVITVANAQTLAASTTAAYALEVEAADDDGTPLTGTTTIAVIVQSCSGGSSGLLAGSLLVLMMSFLALLK